MMSLTCNKKAYPQFKAECDKCPMKTECVDNGEFVAIGLMELPTVNLNVNFMPDISEPTIGEIANRISDMLRDKISVSFRM